MANITPQQFSIKLSRLSSSLLDSRRINEVATTALLRVEGEMKKRIFNQGKATNGSQIGDYAEGPYKRSRVARGKRVDTVNLQNEGDLLKSLRAGKSDEGNPAIGFTSDRQRVIASGHTEYRGKQIFRPSKSEIKIAQDIFQQEVRKLITQSYNG